MSTLQKQVNDMPDEPGVYQFIADGEPLYIGKATSLRDRVRSYIHDDLYKIRGPKIAKMFKEAETIDYEETDSALEAMVLESNLIKKHQPPYNTDKKDNKSYNYVAITEEDYPQVTTVRGRELQTSIDPDELRYTFGPYPNATSLKKALKIVRKIFPYRTRCTPADQKDDNDPCFYAQINLCPGVCTGTITKEDYNNIIENLRLFFEGKKDELKEKLQAKMETAAENEHFKEAQDIKEQLFSLDHIQDVALLDDNFLEDTSTDPDGFRVEGYDIAHISGTAAAGVMTVVENGDVFKQGYRKFKIDEENAGSDTDALKEVLDRRLHHDEWQYPNLIAVDGGKQQVNAIKAVLEKSGFQIPVVGVIKDDRHTPKDIIGNDDYTIEYEDEILLVNSEAHRFAKRYHEKLREKNFIDT